MTHEVYIARYNGEVVYIGSGKVGRNAHVNSGTSNCYELNRLHFSGQKCDIEVIPCGDKQCCEALEKSLVIKYLPRGNKDLFLNELNNPIVNHQLFLIKDINRFINQKELEGVSIRLKPSIVLLLSLRYNSFREVCNITRDVVFSGYANYLVLDDISRRNKGLNSLFQSFTKGMESNNSDFIFLNTVAMLDKNVITFTYDNDLFLKTTRSNFVQVSNYN